LCKQYHLVSALTLCFWSLLYVIVGSLSSTYDFLALISALPLFYVAFGVALKPKVVNSPEGKTSCHQEDDG
jgi:hypothetical protein